MKNKILFVLSILTVNLYAISINSLYTHQTWLDINFYNHIDKIPKEFQEHRKSQVRSIIQDGNGYFLAKDGKYNPKNEMIATIKYLNDKTINNDDKCVYYNRYLFLKEHKLVDEIPLVCSPIEVFVKKHQNSQLSYVQTTEGKDIEESFGHSLFSLKNSDEFIEDFINFGAYDTDNAGGLIGLIDSGFEILNGKNGLNPSYIKDKRVLLYSKIDIMNKYKNKDIFLSTAIIASYYNKMIVFDYYFMSENCSYQLLSLGSILYDEIPSLLNDKNWMTIKPIDAGEVINSAKMEKHSL
jgi:hypothetical protein